MKTLNLSNAGIIVGALALAYWLISQSKKAAVTAKPRQYFGAYEDSAVPDFLAPDDWVSGLNKPQLVYL